jgi:hypothetical protein
MQFVSQDDRDLFLTRLNLLIQNIDHLLGEKQLPRRNRHVEKNINILIDLNAIIEQFYPLMKKEEIKISTKQHQVPGLDDQLVHRKVVQKVDLRAHEDQVLH